MSHTPSVDEIRLCAVHGRDHVTEEEFLRGLEAVRREAKAEALREYAAELEAVPDYMPSAYDRGRVDQRHMVAVELYGRADLIGQEDG